MLNLGSLGEFTKQLPLLRLILHAKDPATHTESGQRATATLVPQQHAQFGVADLPDDVCLCIFELLKHDRQTLWACCLTCRTWAHLAAPYLFCIVNVLMAGTWMELHRPMTHGLSAYIRDLSFWIDHPPASNPLKWHRTVKRSPAENLLRLLTGLETVSLMSMQLRASIAAFLPSVQRLYLHINRISTSEFLPDVLSALPQLRECTLHLALNTEWKLSCRREPVSKAVTSISHLERLHITVLEHEKMDGRAEKMWSCVCAVLERIDSVVLSEVKLKVYHFPAHCDCISPIPCEALDRQLVRLHRLHFPGLAITFHFATVWARLALFPPNPPLDHGGKIADRLPLLRASGARVYCQEDWMHDIYMVRSARVGCLFAINESGGGSPGAV